MSSNNKRSNSYLQPLLLAFALVIGIWIGFSIDQGESLDLLVKMDSKAGGVVVGRLDELVHYIDAQYVDSVNSTQLEDSAIAAIFRQLDPHSYYISAEDIDQFNERLSGRYRGIGVEFILLNDTVTITRVFESGPAAKAGLKKGDRIIKANGKAISGDTLSSEQVIDHLKGMDDSELTLMVKRFGEASPLEIHLKRGEVDIPSIDAAFFLRDSVAYVRINRFSERTYSEYMKALEGLHEEGGIQHLVLDLRQNPGGYLQEAIKIVSQFFEQKDKLLLYTEGQSSQKSEYTSTGNVFYPIDRLVVLIDEGSASASEVIAGILQDLDRGEVIGRRSYGKGLVQEQYDLSDGGAIRLTTARYYLPSGRFIQVPYAGQSEEYLREERFYSGELVDSSKIVLADTQVYYSLRKGRTLYASTGVIPDIFVPSKYDTSMIGLSQVYDYSDRFVFEYCERCDHEFLSCDDVKQWFGDGNELFSLLVEKARNEGIDTALIIENSSLIKSHLLASMGRYYLGNSGFYELSSIDDPDILRALEEIKH